LSERLKRNIKTGVVLAFVVGFVAAFAHPDYRHGEPSLRGTPEHDFAFTLDGKATRLSSMRGHVVLLNFWFSSCPPCIEEAPALNQLQQEIEPRGGTILGVNVDDDPSAYDTFLRQYNVDFPTFRDPSKNISLAYGTTMCPDTYVIRRDGRIDRKFVGAQDWTNPQMLAYLDSLMVQK
jgi:cytochrome c biogenesis protein CcmG, thiol:disulfide interchange protein DsbE